MYIEPNSNIVLLKGIRLDNSYDHTIYFANKQAQYNYFYSKKKVEFTQNYYQRVERGYFKADINAEQLYDVSYMMFRNTAFGDRWFYAFVTSAEYVNNRVTRIGFELDVMQTWMFDYTLLESWVEREHIVQDIVGANIVNEGIPVNDYMLIGNNTGTWSDDNTNIDTDDCVIVVNSTANTDSSYSDVAGGIDANVGDRTYTGSKTFIFNLANYQQLNDYLLGLTQAAKKDAIVNITMMNRAYLPSTLMAHHVGTFGFDEGAQVHCGKKISGDIGNYTVKNKKLFTAPFTYLRVSDGRGQVVNYPQEYWKTPNCYFYMQSCLTADPSVTLVPLGYSTLSNIGLNFDNKITLKGFPQCSWTYDAFEAYLAMNGGMFGVGLDIVSASQHFASAVTQPVSTDIVGDLKKNPMNLIHGAIRKTSGMVDTFRDVYKTIVNFEVINAKPPVIQNNANADVLWNSGIAKYNFETVCIRPEFAKIVDDFFDVFGYATKELKVPNINSRPHWNYVQTKRCAIETDINIDDSRQITEIYDKGITFWKNGDEIGDYSLDNRAW